MNKTKIMIGTGINSPDAIDFVEMLADMYFSWGTKHNYLVTRQSLEGGKVAELLIESAVDLSILYNEVGIHRLVRKSPHDEQGRRHTVFAQVYINGTTIEDTIRSYVLDPYQLAKDHMLDNQTNEVQDVLSGNLELIWG